jgi:hypothetical protein
MIPRPAMRLLEDNPYSRRWVMKNEESRFALNSVTIYLAAITLLSVLASPILAQRPPPPPGTSGIGVDEARVRMADNTRREVLLREDGTNSKGPVADPRKLQASINQIRQDFTRIQVVRNELVRALLKGSALNYRFVSDQTREIRKSAGRLKTDLRLYDPNSDEKIEQKPVEVDQTHIKGELVKLCNTIFSFTENPALKSPDLVDLNNSARAKTDLQRIIDLSESISKGAEKLTEGPKK